MRLRAWIPIGALVAGWLAASALVLGLVLQARDQALERGARAAEALAHAMEDHAVRTLESAQLTVRGLADTWALTRPGRNDPAFQALLARRLADLPYVRALFVVGADGRLIHDTDYPKTPDVSLADRPYFAAARERPGAEGAVYGPYLSRSGGEAGWFIAVTAPLWDKGEFRGVVVAAVRPDQFGAMYGRMALGEGEVMALLNHAGSLIARYPPGEQPGTSFSGLPLFSALAQHPSGSYRAEGHMVPGMRLVAYRSVPGLPLVVLASLGEQAVLSEWRRSTVGAAVAMAALTLLLAGVLARQVGRGLRLERQRRQRAQAEKLEALGRLTGGIAHDFGNVLTVISSNLHIIGMAPQDTQQVARAAAVARRAVENGANLISRLLAFARRQPLELKAADLNTLVAQAQPLVAQAAGSRIELVVQLAPDLPPVLTDESQFEIALLNLVMNARDAITGTGRIALRTHAGPGGDPCLTVEDNGPGMREDVRQRAMEPFFTTKGEGGTGLGLAQVHGFMAQAGGSLALESAPGRGTRVHLQFRRASAKMPSSVA